MNILKIFAVTIVGVIFVSMHIGAVEKVPACKDGKGVLNLSLRYPIFDDVTDEVLRYEEYIEPMMEIWSDVARPINSMYFKSTNSKILLDNVDIYYLSNKGSGKKQGLKNFKLSKQKELYKINDFIFSKYMSEIKIPDGQVFFVFKNKEVSFCQDKVTVMHAADGSP